MAHVGWMMPRAPLPAIAATLLLFAGCLGTGGPASTTDSTNEAPTGSVEVEPGVVVASNKAILKGVVRTEDALPIKGARASLLGTDHFADTDAGGNFTLQNVSAGSQELSVSAAGFRVHSQKVELKAGELTRLDIVLAPDEDLNAAYRPHLHDYWRERAEVKLMDHDLDLTSREANGQSGIYSDPLYARTGKANDNRSGQASDSFYFNLKSVDAEDPPIIFPGAREVQVTFSWSQENVRLDQLGLIYSYPGISKPAILPPKASGGTWRIAVDPASTDDGHDRSSAWQLYVYTPNDKDQPTTWKPGLITGPMHVRVVLLKGELFLEPEHPTFWNGNETALVRSSATAVKFAVSDRTGGSGGLKPDGKNLVPPGTGTLRLMFWYYYEDALNGTRYNDWVLTWRTPAQAAATPLSEYKRVAPAKEENGFKLYEFQVPEADWDPFYAKSSRWLWLPSPKGQEDANQLGTNDDYYRGQVTAGLKFRLAVVALKDPAFE